MGQLKMTVDDARDTYFNYKDPSHKVIVFVVDYGDEGIYAHTFANANGGTCDCCRDMGYIEYERVIKVFNAVTGEVIYSEDK